MVYLWLQVKIKHVAYRISYIIYVPNINEKLIIFYMLQLNFHGEKERGEREEREREEKEREKRERGGRILASPMFDYEYYSSNSSNIRSWNRLRRFFIRKWKFYIRPLIRVRRYCVISRYSRSSKAEKNVRGRSSLAKFDCATSQLRWTLAVEHRDYSAVESSLLRRRIIHWRIVQIRITRSI